MNKIVRCSSCGALCRWVKTERGKMMLVNAEPDPKGNIVIQDDIARVFRPDLIFDTIEERWMPHWPVCPDAKQWRKLRRGPAV